MNIRQITFGDISVGEQFICFDPGFSLHYTIPVLRKLPELTDSSGNRYNAVFVSKGHIDWIDSNKLIVRVE